MTVGELIEKLQEMPPGLHVGIRDADTLWDLHIERVVLELGGLSYPAPESDRVVLSGSYGNEL